MTIVESLIYDRTQADVEQAAYLGSLWDAQTGEWTGTALQLAQWMGGLKGTCNASDLNRVGQAVQYVADRMTAAGYSVTVSPKMNWNMTDIPTTTAMAAYLGNVRALRAVLTVTAPQVPLDMDGLTWQQANDIERILVEIDAALTRLVQSVNFGWAMAQAHVGLYIPQRPALLLTQDGLALLAESGEYLDIALFGLPACKRIDKTAVLMLAGANQNYKLEVTAWRQ